MQGAVKLLLARLIEQSSWFMARDLSSYLQVILEACNSIQDVMNDVSLDEYRSKRAVRSAVEREFIIIGEALGRVGALDC
jgi:uncharacterized protein with HEPN domain